MYKSCEILPDEYAFIRPDKGRNITALRMQQYLRIKNKINFEKDRDAEGNVYFKDLTQEQIEGIRNKNLIIYDDEEATFGTMAGVINKVVSANAGVKSITIMLGHTRFVEDYVDKTTGKYHSGWRQNIKKIMEEAAKQNPPIELKFMVSDSRQALGDIYSFARKNEED